MFSRNFHRSRDCFTGSEQLVRVGQWFRLDGRCLVKADVTKAKVRTEVDVPTGLAGYRAPMRSPWSMFPFPFVLAEIKFREKFVKTKSI